MCDACRRKASHGAEMRRRTGQEPARFVLCVYHARNLINDWQSHVWELPEEHR